MAKVNVRELARNTSRVIDGVTRRGEAALVTRDGLPVAAIVPIDADALDRWILANSPDSVEGVRLMRASEIGATGRSPRAARPRRPRAGSAKRR